jgi:Family of unknown function (DUF5723)
MALVFKMRNLLFIFLQVWFSGFAYGQNFKGFNASKQGGFYGMINQPARILDGEKRLNINVIGLDLNVLAGSQPTSASSIFKSGGSPDLLKLAFVGKADAAIYARIVLPALTYKINDRFSIGFLPQYRTILLGRYTNPGIKSFLKNLTEGNTATTNTFNNSDQFASVYMHNWLEFGFPFGYELYNKGQHRLQLAGNFKLISGNAAARFEVNGLTVEPGTLDSIKIDGAFSLVYNANLDGLVTENKAELELFQRAGIGLDIGVRYTFFRSEEDKAKNQYFFDAGVSLIDFGEVKYNPSDNSTSFDFNNRPILLSLASSNPSLSNLVDTLKSIELNNNAELEPYIIELPAQLMVQLDVMIYRNLYLNLQASYRLTGFRNVEAFKNYYEVVFTPKWEDEKFGFYLPYTIRRNIRNSLGFAFNYKSFFIGSANLFSGLANQSEQKYINAYLGASFSILKEKSSVKDSSLE